MVFLSNNKLSKMELSRLGKVSCFGSKMILAFFLSLTIALVAKQESSVVNALWFFQSDLTAVTSPNQTQSSQPSAQLPTQSETTFSFLQRMADVLQQSQQIGLSQESPASNSTLSLGSTSSVSDQQQVDTASAAPPASGYSTYGSNFLSYAGLQPSSIATILNSVGDTGFRYFNIQDQCRHRAACDLGFMLYRKLSFVHNWLIRTSVRTLTDMSNVYTQSWMEGMLGRNCSAVFVTCRQSPLEGLMNLALLQHLAM